MANEDKEKKEYELALLVKNESDLPGVFVLINQHNAEGVSEPRAKRLQLTYEIKHHTDAVFAYLTFKMNGLDIKALEHDLVTRADVLRFMVIASPAPAERTAASPMPPREERRPRTPSYGAAPSLEAPKPPAPRPLSNEALEKKIEEILQ